MAMKRIKIAGLVLPFSEQPNGNHRIYTKDSISDDVINEFKKEISEKNCLGECFLNNESEGLDTILLANVSHMVTHIEKREEGIYGEIELLDTPKGNFLKDLVQNAEDPFSVIAVRPRCKGMVGVDEKVYVANIMTLDVLGRLNDAFNPDSYKNRRYKFNRNLKNNKEEA